MITTPEQYNAHLVALQNRNFPSKTPPFVVTPQALLNDKEKIYYIDLNQRLIHSPEFIGVEKDQFAETIYFAVDRYFDYIDLKDTVCIIQYTNANKKTRLYAVPFYDITTKSSEGLMLIPWNVGAGATEAPGEVVYNMHFYRLGDNNEFEYSLYTQPATTKVLHSLKVENIEEDYLLDADQYSIIMSRIEEIDRQDLYWTDLYSY